MARQGPQQQAFDPRQPIALCALVPEPWPDTDDEIAICMIGQSGAPQDEDHVWALWDSGSGLTTCPSGFFPEGRLHAAKDLPPLVTATGAAVHVEQACTVNLAAETGDVLAISFQESNVDKVIISAAESLPPGASAIVSRDGPSYIEFEEGRRIPLHRSNGALWLRLRRTPQTTGGGGAVLTIAAASASTGP